MKKILFICLFVGASWFHTNTSHAVGFSLDATLGSSHTFNIGGQSHRDPLHNFGANFEILPSVQFLMLSADLGIQYDFVQNNMTLRPGMRLHLGWLYLRTAIPLAFSFGRGVLSEPFDMGVLVGAGVRIRLGKWAFVAEGNVSPLLLHASTRGVSMPAEFRMGVSYAF